MKKLCMTFDTGDIAAPHDAAALQAEFREQHAGVFDALQRSMDVASTSGEPVPDCIRQVSMWTLNSAPSPNISYITFGEREFILVTLTQGPLHARYCGSRQ